MLDKDFWEERYVSGETGWDMGMVSPPLASYIDQLKNKILRILIPGCGNAYEAAYLHQCGFSDVTLIDLADTPVNNLRKKFNGASRIRIIKGDFFEHSGQYDLILEQTFFCAIDPVRRKDYVSKMIDLLAPGGILAGVLFDKQFDKPGPPFGGSAEEYRILFSSAFNLRMMESCKDSHPKRQGSELFIELERK
jgi:SAM-dependent methyltransferase